MKWYNSNQTEMVETRDLCHWKVVLVQDIPRIVLTFTGGSSMDVTVDIESLYKFLTNEPFPETLKKKQL